jgi:DNA-binding transcriptional MerR regulator/cytoskeletal protein CcmA (bactofilin family)
MKIGEFAKLSSATILTLRYYDDLGLLKPDSIDKETGYRIYSSMKLEQMRQIKAMKEIGFTLLEIKSFLAIVQSNETEKIDFVTAKKQEIELEKQKAESRLTALDEFIIKLKEGEKQMESKNYYAPFSEDERMMNWYKKMTNWYKENTDPPYGNINGVAKLVKIYAGTAMFGAIDENGKVCMWGHNWGEQCNIPENLPPIIELGIGHAQIVALDIHGKLHNWGNPQCSNPPYNKINFPNDLPEIISVKANGYITRALSKNGEVFSWGEYNESSQKYVPKNMGFVKHIAITGYGGVAVNSENKCFKWGMYSNSSPLPEDIEIISIAATNYDLIYLSADGKVYGDTKYRQRNIKFKPKPEFVNIRIKKIAASLRNFAALDENGKVYVWGEYNEMPDGRAVTKIPLNLPQDIPIIDVAVGNYADILCLGADGKIYAWGDYGGVVPAIFDGFKDEGPIFEPVEIDINEPRDVYTFDELCEAVQDKIKNITIKDNMTIKGESFYVTNTNTLTVAENVTLTVKSMNFIIRNKLINNGTIELREYGRIVVFNEIEGTGSINKPDVVNGFSEITLHGININDNDELFRYLAEYSIYTNIFYPNSEETVIEIDKDLTIPKGKTLTLNTSCTLKVNEGVTLTVEGNLDIHRNPIIEGTVIGNINNNSIKECDVYTYEELCEATNQLHVTEPGKRYKNFEKITIKADMTAAGDNFRIDNIYNSNLSLVIDEGVTLTVNCDDFTIMGEFINNGVINGTGNIYVDDSIKGTGNINTSGGLKISIYDLKINELKNYLTEDSIYTTIYYTGINPPLRKSLYFPKRGEPTYITIEKDLIIPKNKSIWLHANCILKINETATLKINGKIETFNEPIIDGKVIGDITFIDVNTPCDVYTISELYEASRYMINEITLKDNITLTSNREQMTFNTLIIDKNITLTCEKYYFTINKKLINKGIIKGTGNIQVQEIIDGEPGINTADGLEISVTINDIDEIKKYLTKDSIYKNLRYGFVIIENNKIKEEQVIIEIETDLTIPKDKSLWLNPYCTLKINETATLKIDGKLQTYNPPIINGTLTGNIDILEKWPNF